MILLVNSIALITDGQKLRESKDNFSTLGRIRTINQQWHSCTCTYLDYEERNCNPVCLKGSMTLNIEHFTKCFHKHQISCIEQWTDTIE